MSEIREYKGKQYNIDNIKAHKAALQAQKAEGLKLIEEQALSPEVAALVEQENERRKLEYADLDSQIMNVDNLMTVYTTKGTPV